MKRPAKRKRPTPAEAGGCGAARAVERSRRNFKLAELIAFEIVKFIMAEQLRPGDRLPLEAQMLKRYQVARPTLREAIRLLEFQGLIMLRTGPGRGPVVGDATPEHLAQTLTLYLHLLNSTYGELYDANREMQPILARRAAQNADRKRVLETMSPFVDSEQPPGPVLNFHVKVGDLAGNSVLQLCCQAISAVHARKVVDVIPREMAQEIVEEHRKIAKAIIAGKASAAARLMEQHMTHLITGGSRSFQAKHVGERLRWGDAEARSGADCTQLATATNLDMR
jgi:GntR family transcriptional repressor for pyruvate dehydrogenase complex